MAEIQVSHSDSPRADSPILTSWGGTGEPVLFVHGDTPAGPLSWLQQRELRGRFDLAVMTRAGFGRRSELRIDARRDAEDLGAALTEPVHLVGHSHGAVVATLTAAANPAMIRSVTLIEPPLFQLTPHHPAVRAVMREFTKTFGTHARQPILGGTLRALFGESVDSPGAVPGAAADLHAKIADAVLPWTHTIDMRPIRENVSALVVRGTWSAAFNAVCDQIADELGTTATLIHGSDHSPHRNPGEFNPILVRHLTSGSFRPVDPIAV